MHNIARIYIDCEFNGHLGQLISIGLYQHSEDNAYFWTDDFLYETDGWIDVNVRQRLGMHDAKTYSHCINSNAVAANVRKWVQNFKDIHAVADNSMDIAYFAGMLHTGPAGEYIPWDGNIGYFVKDVDCWEGSSDQSMRHNAWQDARRLHDYLEIMGGN